MFSDFFTGNGNIAFWYSQRMPQSTLYKRSLQLQNEGKDWACFVTPEYQKLLNDI